jgi:hypothetical protein
VQHLVAHDVLQLLGGALHQAAALQGEDGGEAVIEPAALEDRREEEVGQGEFVQVVPVGQVEVGAHHPLQAPVGQGDLAVDGGDHPVAVVDLLLVEADALDAVLVGPGVQGFLIHLAGLVDLQLGGAHLLHHRQADVAHGQDVGGGEVGQHVLEDVALGAAQLVVVVVHVLGHGDLQGRPVVAVGLEEELPGPGVLEGRQLVDVGLATDDALVGGIHRGQGMAQGGSLRWHPQVQCPSRPAPAGGQKRPGSA